MKLSLKEGLVLLAILVLPFVTFANHVTPQVVDSNTTCQDLGYWFSVEVKPAVSGTFALSPPTYDAEVVMVDDYTLDWSADVPLSGMLIFGPPGQGGYHYQYFPPDYTTYSDEGLVAPNNHKIRRYVICHDLR